MLCQLKQEDDEKQQKSGLDGHQKAYNGHLITAYLYWALYYIAARCSIQIKRGVTALSG
jgi:hypothetical protein